MNKFRKLGFIEYNGGLQINTSLLSAVLHNWLKPLHPRGRVSEHIFGQQVVHEIVFKGMAGTQNSIKKFLPFRSGELGASLQAGN